MSAALAVVGDSTQAQLLAAASAAALGEPVDLVGNQAAGTWDPVFTSGMSRQRVEVRRVTQLVAGVALFAAPDVESVLGLCRAYVSTDRDTLAVLVPGGAGGALLAAASLPVARVAEVSGFPVLGSVEGDVASASTRKERLPLGLLDAKTPIPSVLTAALPGLETSDVLATSTANTNHVIHPALAAARLDEITSGRPFRFYREGLSRTAVSRVLEVDHERLGLTGALGLPRIGIVEWLDRFYAGQGMRGTDLLERLATFAPFEHSPGPATVHHRYLVDDVRYGIAVYEWLGKHLGVRTPAISALVTILSDATGLDLRDRAAVLGRLLIDHARRLPTTLPRESSDPGLVPAS